MADDLSQLVSSIQGLAGNVAESNKPKENGPGDVQPSLEVKTSQLVTLEMPEDDIKQWFVRIEASKQRRMTREEKWDVLLNEYLPIVSKSGEAETVKMNLHFRNVHTKMASLFYQRPDLILTSKDPGPANNQMPAPVPPGGLMPGAPPPPPLTMEEVIALKQAVLNDKLGPDDIDVEELMDELLFDVLAWAGLGCCKVGYRCVTKKVPRPKLIPQQTEQPGSVLGLSTPPRMVPDPSGATEDVPVDIFEEWYIRRFSPKKLLLDDALYSSRIGKDSTWIGMEFFMSQARAMKPAGEGGLGLTEDQAKAVAKDDRRHEYDEDKSGENMSGLVHGYEIFCLSSIHGTNPHPKAINQLILIDGDNTRPYVWRPCVDQTFDESGVLTQDSITEFPIQILTLRVLADSPYIPSDSAFTNSHIKQISTWRRQSIKMRDSASGRYLYDKGAFDDTEIDKLKNGEVGDFIGVEDGKLGSGKDVVVPVAQAHMTSDDYRGMELLKRDNDEMLGIGSTQSGTPEATVQTATQIAEMTKALATRNRKEQRKASKFYLQTVRMLDQLLMRYATNTDYVLVGGEEAEQKPVLWNNKVISGRYLYTISPDSQLQVDTEQDFRLTLQYYNLTAGDPLSNRPYLLKRLARMRNLDPAKAVLPPAPPANHPLKPNLSVTLKGDDLLMTVDANGQPVPVNPVAMRLVTEASAPEPSVPPGFAGSLPPHGGAGGAANKHEQSNSGKRQNEPGSINHRESQGV